MPFTAIAVTAIRPEQSGIGPSLRTNCPRRQGRKTCARDWQPCTWFLSSHSSTGKGEGFLFAYWKEAHTSPWSRSRMRTPRQWSPTALAISFIIHDIASGPVEIAHLVQKLSTTYLGDVDEFLPRPWCCGQEACWWMGPRASIGLTQ